MSAVDRLRVRWASKRGERSEASQALAELEWRRQVEERNTERAEEVARIGAPFSEPEILLLAFGLQHEWSGPPLTSERWRTWGSTVMRAHAARVKAERIECFRAGRKPPARPDPWPLTAGYGEPTRA